MTTNNKKKAQLSGTFTLPDGQEVYGNLHLKKSNTVLQIHPKTELSPLGKPCTINGTLGDLRKVSCIESLVGPTSSGYRKGDGHYHYAEIFPHFVTIGHRHFSPIDPTIKGIRFTTQDISLLFHDFHAFGHRVISKLEAENLLDDGKSKGKITFGDSPSIVYFSGKTEIIAVDTPIGLFRVSHRPAFSVGSIANQFITNDIHVNLEFADPIAFDECVDRLLSIQMFLSVVAGRKQAVESISLDLLDERDKKNSSLDLHWMFAPKRPKNNENKLHPGDIPLDAVRRPEEFKTALATWLSQEPSRRIARVRYAGCVSKSNVYSIDRLVAAANMFDILPTDSEEVAVQLSDELAKAQIECRAIFKRLAPGPERDSVLGALGRISKASLTKKVLRRVAIVTDKFGSKLPELALAAKTAITVRNYFVHGNPNRFDYERIEPSTPFLTDTLEFVFASSDLIDAGWDAEMWNSQQHGYGHSFARFLWSYREEINLLKEALS